MGYTKTWIPPSVPFRADLNAWKVIVNDLHDNLIQAGLVQTDDTGQLDVDSVTVLPEDLTYAGYRLYRFNDALQASCPIFIKLDIGCGSEGMGSSSNYRRSRCLNIQVTVSNATDGSGGLEVMSPVIRSRYPQGYNQAGGSVTTQLVSAGTSFACSNTDSGFFGFVYGAGSRNNPLASQYGAYTGCTLALFIQRDTINGIPADTGFSVYLQRSYASSSSGGEIAGDDYKSMYWKVTKGSNSTIQSNNAFVRQMGNIVSPLSGVAQLHPVSIIDGEGRLSQCPSLFTYRTEDIQTGNIIDVALTPGTPSKKFIALGPHMMFRTDHYTTEETSIAMLYE